jgi:hypothetical protein
MMETHLHSPLTFMVIKHSGITFTFILTTLNGGAYSINLSHTNWIEQHAAFHTSTTSNIVQTDM